MKRENRATEKTRPLLQKVVELPPNLKSMVSPFLVLTQCKITEKAAGQCSAYHLSV